MSEFDDEHRDERRAYFRKKAKEALRRAARVEDADARAIFVRMAAGWHDRATKIETHDVQASKPVVTTRRGA